MSAFALARLPERALAGDVVSYRLAAMPMRYSPAPGVVVDAVGYNGSIPGPVLRVVHGQRVHVEYVNQSPIQTTVHWHGMVLPNAMDGVAGVTQRAGATRRTIYLDSRPIRPVHAGITIMPVTWAYYAGSSGCSSSSIRAMNPPMSSAR